METEITGKVQFLAITASIALLIFIVELIRRKKIKEEYSLIWLFSGIMFLFFSIWRDALNYLSELVGIYYPPATLFLLLFIGIFSLLIHFSAIISKITEKNKLLTQELGIYKMELDLLKKEIKNKTTEKESLLLDK